MNTHSSRPLVLNVTETAKVLGVSRTHAYELVARGVVSHVRLGRRIVVPVAAIDALLDVGSHTEARDAS